MIARMDTLLCIRSFVRVAESGSFAKAARRLGISPSLVTKHVQALERRIGTRLINRNTRRTHLTEAGVLYCKHCQAMLGELEEIEAEAAGLGRLPRGRLRLTAAYDFGSGELEPAILEFMRKYPDIAIEFEMTSRFVDVIQEEFDLAVRISGQPLDGTLVGRRLATSRLVVCAAPAYLDRHGRPKDPDDLQRHAALVYTGVAWRAEWPFARGGELRKVRVLARLQSNNNQMLCRAAICGVGVTIQPTFNIWRELRSGELETVLDDWHIGELGVYVVFPHRQLLPAKVRVFIDFLAERLRGGGDRDVWIDRAMQSPRVPGTPSSRRASASSGKPAKHRNSLLAE